ncbi:MAG: hypothetical protein ACI9JL_002333 [Paracoccaceae bacterium]|jgi:hypothetical protein
MDMIFGTGISSMRIGTFIRLSYIRPDRLVLQP